MKCNNSRCIFFSAAFQGQSRIIFRYWFSVEKTLGEFLSLSKFYPLTCKNGGSFTLSTQSEKVMGHDDTPFRINLCMSHHSTLSSQVFLVQKTIKTYKSDSWSLSFNLLHRWWLLPIEMKEFTVWKVKWKSAEWEHLPLVKKVLHCKSPGSSNECVHYQGPRI